MWRGRTPALVLYGLVCVRVWRGRGFADSTADQIAEFAPEVVDSTQAELAAAGLLPSWLGDERLHRSHRSKLLAKDPDHYRPLFPGDPDDLDYVWPAADPGPDAAELATGRPLWVLRPESTALLGRFLEAGAVGFTATSGIEVDATGRDLAGLRELLGTGGRRPTRALLALSRFVGADGSDDGVRTGDEVAVPVQGGHALLLGQLVGDYAHDPADPTGLRHRRAVRFDRVVPRAAVSYPASLQDVRPLFSVRLADPVADPDVPGAFAAPDLVTAPAG